MNNKQQTSNNAQGVSLDAILRAKGMVNEVAIAAEKQRCYELVKGNGLSIRNFKPARER
jgi:hypothetical protein